MAMSEWATEYDVSPYFYSTADAEIVSKGKGVQFYSLLAGTLLFGEEEPRRMVRLE